MKHKTQLVIIGCIALFLIMIGLTYAAWRVSRSQTNYNDVIATCLDLSLTNEQNDISLPEILPMTDDEGLATTPYTFTVTNECNRKIDYQINLESLNIRGKSSGDYLPANSLKYSIDARTPKILGQSPQVSTTIDGAYESYKLAVGTLAANGSASHSLKIWLGDSSTISDQGKVYKSKISITIGQGVFNPYKEGTLAYDILDNYGGETAITKIDTTWIELEPEAEKSTYVTKGARCWNGTSYEFNPETGKFKLTGDLVQATLDECRNGTKSCGNYTLINSSETQEQGLLYKITSFTSSTQADTSNAQYMTAQAIRSKNGFSEPTTASEAGLYKAEDDLGESYYFRGAPTNNYVKFGTYAEDTTIDSSTNITAGTPMFWRIVRINGDRTIRLVYDGTKLTSNGTDHTASINNSAYNTNKDQAKYVGYTYDTSDTDKTQVDSTIKSVVDAWYDKHLETNYGKYIADGIFCNDREVSSTSGSSIYYAPYERLENNKKPQLTCTNKSDRYTISDTLGNGLLSNPIGLLTADEVMFAGVSIYPADNETFYLYNNKYWSMSTPAYYSNNGAIGNAIVFSSRSQLNFSISTNTREVRPVINLKNDVTFTGNGTMDDPYVIG